MKRIIEWIKNLFKKPQPVYEEYDIGRTEVIVKMYDGTKHSYWVTGIAKFSDFYDVVKSSESIAKETVMEESRSGIIGISSEEYVNIRDVSGISFKTTPYMVKKAV